MQEIEFAGYLSSKEKVVQIAKECIELPVSRYNINNDKLFVGENFNGCVAFVKFVLRSAGVVVPDFIGPDNIRRSLDHVNEFYDHFGIIIPYGKHGSGDLIFYSWSGNTPQHIGVVVDQEHYIHAHTKDGRVHINRIASSPIVRATNDSIFSTNPIGFKRPTTPNDNDRWPQRPW